MAGDEDRSEGGPVLAEGSISEDTTTSATQSSSKWKEADDASEEQEAPTTGSQNPDEGGNLESDGAAPAWFTPYLNRLAQLEKAADDRTKSTSNTPSTSNNDRELSLEVKRLSMEKWQPGRGFDRNEIRSNVLVVYYKTVIKMSATDKSSNTSELLEVPQRVQINSRPLLAELEFMTGTTMARTPCVMIPPFKVFVTYRDKIAEELKAKKASISQWETDMEKESRLIGPRDARAEEEKKREKLAMEHLECLLTWIDEDLAGALELRKQVQSRTLKRISYENLWHLFRVGDMVFNNEEALKGRDMDWLTYPRAYRVYQIAGGRPSIGGTRRVSQLDTSPAPTSTDKGPEKRDGNQDEFKIPFRVGLHCTDYDGSYFSPYFGAATFTFRDFKGEKPIMELEFYPADFDPNYATRRQYLIDRGRKFLELLQPSHRYYNGLTLNEDPEDIDGEVVVDPRTCVEMEPENMVFDDEGLSRIKFSNQSAEFYEATGCGDESCSGCTNNWDDNLLEYKYYDDYLPEEHGLQTIWASDAKSKITDEHLVYMPRDIPGFVLRTRTWKWLDIELIKRVEEQEQEERLGFEELVINQKHKDMVLALVRSHHSGPRAEAGGSMDLVRGKGRGLIILLHGAPGVGKTSTAETVAAYTKRPLYPITCGDIGEKADQVEKTLEKHFQLAHKWGCVLLLDEADVFLAKRTEGDVQRNALVSVFLRTLEYYSGILFLTTNRLGVIDEAFHSRIKMSFFYDNLNWERSRKIWRNCLNKIKRANDKASNTDDQLMVECVDEDAILDFAHAHFEANRRLSQWNGRQIRNAFQTAIALARYDLHAKADKRMAAGKLSKEDAERKEKWRTVKLTAEHFEKVAEVTTEYHKYVKRMQKGKTPEQLAVLSQLRATGEESETATPTLSGRPRLFRQAVSTEEMPGKGRMKKKMVAQQPGSVSDSEERRPPEPAKKKNGKQPDSESNSSGGVSDSDDD
ncbi:aaa family atpase [Diplodia corticola]|uniref:Aaa family atpase n=1 Tax=Diplodia corticola TaxID=236234 RepID=A0A1J9RSK8_9PEZI|nr:aaa family atpase [Diplodia corticola]OJD30509.1 aaa family atpase [Diplodia corticola]